MLSLPPVILDKNTDQSRYNPALFTSEFISNISREQYLSSVDANFMVPGQIAAMYGNLGIHDDFWKALASKGWIDLVGSYLPPVVIFGLEGNLRMVRYLHDLGANIKYIAPHQKGWAYSGMSFVDILRDKLDSVSASQLPRDIKQKQLLLDTITFIEKL